MPAKPAPSRPPTLAQQVRGVLADFERLGSPRHRDNLARYGIVARNAFGVSVAQIQKLSKRLGRSHELALALWETDCFEARMLAAFVDEPARVTPAQMDRWCRDFDNWAICDTLCFKLFDRTPHAWAKVARWSRRRAEFEKRAAFALLASIAGHDKQAPDELFVGGLRRIERAADDERNFVKKGVSWALRGIGHRNAALHAAALACARKLAQRSEPAARWVGKDALRDLSRPAVLRKVAARGRARVTSK